VTVINFAEALANAQRLDEPVGPGVYDCEVTKVEPGTTKNGDLTYKVSFKVLTGPQANRGINHWINFIPTNPTSMGFFLREMAILGLDQNFWAAATALDPAAVPAYLVGKQARVTLTPGDRKWPDTALDLVPGGALTAAPGPGVAPPPVAPAPAPGPGVPAPAPVAPAPVMPVAPAPVAPAPVAPAPAPVAPAPAPVPAPAPAPAPVAPAPAPAPVPPTPQF